MAENIKNSKEYKWKFAWVNIVLLGLLHICALYGLFLKFGECKLQTSVFYKLIGFISTLGITGGAHRLWSHRSYKANRILEIILMCLASLTYQNSIYVWCRDHRLHHKYSETDADPHNAKRGFFFSHMGWLLIRKHPDVKEKGKEIDMSDLQANPIVMFQHKYYYPIVFIGTFGITTFVPWYFWNEKLLVSIFTATIYRYIGSVHITWCINSLAHLYGNKPYNKTIGPTENIVMMHCGLGEGFHNYHHTFPYDYKAAELGNDTRNMTTILIDCFAKLGWATDRLEVPESLIKKCCLKTGDNNYAKTNLFTNVKNFVIGFIVLTTII